MIILGVPPVGALDATYQVLPNATSYAARVDITGASDYLFADTDMLGENVPVSVTNVTLIAENGTPVDVNWTKPWNAPSSISFPKGNYTVAYVAPLSNNQIQESYFSPYNVSVNLPGEYDVRNPLLAGLSQGANVTRLPDNSTVVSWNQTTSFEIRFYDQAREDLLYLFAEFMVIRATILLLPFFLTRKPPEE